jgi:prolyl-tRNA synthetase
MRISELFTKTLREAPRDESAKNAQLLIRAGYVYKEMAGVYAYLPLGLRVVEKIKAIVREEMNAVGGQELIMTNLQPRETWEPTGRWDEKVVDVWFKTKMASGEEVGLAWSHEEPILKMMQQYVGSYRDLGRELVGAKGAAVYQFQTKLRNELRAKSGIMRGREFVMKDMYSLHASQGDLDEYYEKVKEAYGRIYERLGLGEDTFVTFASGGAFTKFSHEFQTVCGAGEDWLYLDRERGVGVNEEVLEEAIAEGIVERERVERVRSAEVGNIFNFGDEKARQMGVYYTNEKNEQVPVFLASYGVGVTRVMGVIAEKFSDEKGLVWPEAVAPFAYYLVGIGEEGEKVARELYVGNEDAILFDDRDARVGEKMADSELMGIPVRVVVSDRTLAEGKVEWTERKSSEKKMLTLDELRNILG